MRIALYVLWALLTGASFVNAQAIVPAVEAPRGLVDGDMLKWAVTQGGLVLVTLAVMWSYRRDFKTQASEKDEKLAVLADLVRNNTAAMTQLSELIRAQR